MRGIFSFLQSFMAERTSHGLAFDLRNAIFSKIQRMSFSFYDRNQTGQLMVRATDDVERVRTFVAQGLVLAAQSFLLLIGALIVLAFTNWQLTLVIVPLLPLALAIFFIFGRISQPLFLEVQNRLSRLNTILQENIAGMKVVKAFARESYEEERFDRAATALMEQQIRVNRIFAFLFPVIFLIAQLGQVAILIFRWSANLERYACAWRVSEVQPLPGIRLFPTRSARFHYCAAGSGWCLCRTNL
jgi:ATP-binding cassette subfamily B protein